MSVSVYIGATESGKSFHVKKHVIPSFKKVVVFDPAHCFNGDLVLVAPGADGIKGAFRRFRDKDSFRIVFRTNGSCKDEEVFKDLVILAKAFGKDLKKKKSFDENIQVVVDEVTASEICSSGYIDPHLKWLVCKGRHELLDCHLITQYPMAIHNMIRVQATKCVCFFLNNAEGISYVSGTFSRKIAEKISQLERFHHMAWKNNGEIAEYNKNNKLVQIYGKKPEKNTEK